MKLLVGAENLFQFRYYRDLLKHTDFELIHAATGPSVIAAADDVAPDLFVLDRELPGLDGFQTALRLRALPGSAFTPILFITRDSDPAILSRFYIAGACDVIVKPIDANLFAAKIDAQRRTRAHNESIQRDREALRDARTRLEREEALAARILNRAQGSELPRGAQLEKIFRPMSDCSGDLLVGAISPRNSLYLLIADATGHGLPAAISALPVARIFYAMAHKGLNIGDIAQEINHDLQDLLPDDMLVAAHLIEINEACTRMTAWCGGLPDIWILSTDGSLQEISSEHMPLGAEFTEDFERSIQIIPLQKGDRIYFQTDGITESFSEANEMFGEERLLELLRRLRSENDASRRFQQIEDQLQVHLGKAAQTDDFTLLELTAAPLNIGQPNHLNDHAESMVNWNLHIDLDANAMRYSDPVIQIVEMMGSSPGFPAHKDILFTILAEMYTNALDHGVLALDSALKHDEEGFIEYYTEKERRLEALQSGEISIHTEFKRSGNRGELLLQIQDSGTGFNYQQILDRDPDDEEAHGRGLALIISLCGTLHYSDNGRCLKVIYPMVFSQS